MKKGLGMDKESSLILQTMEDPMMAHLKKEWSKDLELCTTEMATSNTSENGKKENSMEKASYITTTKMKPTNLTSKILIQLKGHEPSSMATLKKEKSVEKEKWVFLMEEDFKGYLKEWWLTERGVSITH